VSQNAALGPRSISESGPPVLTLAAPVTVSQPLRNALDRVAAGIALVLLVPFLLLLALAIRVTSNGPALYGQERVGFGGRPFRMWKLRTMHADADERRADLSEALGWPPLFKMVDDPRVTGVGRFLRRWSLDELPQLWNIVKGDMSLVGPRPCMPDEVAAYREGLARRFEVKPGITGLWQVSGRSTLSWEESVRLDLAYVADRSLGLDVRILCRTLPAVLRRDGAY
jgi:lipopolysaccharide/colanic/teichoic acid biosynthesis glycosyltransferase